VLKGSYDAKCDMWSIGVILYILISGKPPFDGKDDQEILENVAKGTPEYSSPIWSKVSKDGQDIVKRLLHKNPVARLSA